MKTVTAIFISSLLILFSLSSTTAQDDTSPYPPITPENANQLEMIQVLSKGTPRDFSWSPDGTQLAITAEGGTWIYDVTDEDMPSYWVKGHNSSPRIVYAPHHDFYISYESLYDCAYGDCPRNSKTYIRNSKTHEILYEIPQSQSAIAQFSPDGNLLAIGTYSGGIRVWSTESFLTQDSENPDDFMLCRISTAASPKKIIFSPDNSWISYEGYGSAMMSPEDTSLWFWDANTCELKLQAVVIDTEDYINSVYTSFLANSPDGRYVIIPSYTDEKSFGLYLWDTITWENPVKLPKEITEETLIGFSADSQQIIFTLESKIKVWDIVSETIIDEKVGHDAISLGNNRLLIVKGYQLYISENDVEQQISENEWEIEWIKISHNKRWLISYHSNQEMKLWDLEQKIFIHSWQNLPVDLISFSPINDLFIWKNQFTGSISIFSINTLEEYSLAEFQPIGVGLFWSQSREIVMTLGRPTHGWHENQFIDGWSYAKNSFQHLWRIPYQWGEFKTITDDFILLERNQGEGTTTYFEFFDIQTGILLDKIALSDCDSNLTRQSNCAILAILFSNELQVKLSEDRRSLNIIDSSETIIESYPIPAQVRDISDVNSSWQFDKNGDLLLATQATLYNLTQNTILAQIPAFPPDESSCDECDGEPDYFQVERTWLSEDLRFLISLQNDNSLLSWVAQSAIIVWSIEDNRELYHLLTLSEIVKTKSDTLSKL